MRKEVKEIKWKGQHALQHPFIQNSVKIKEDTEKSTPRNRSESLPLPSLSHKHHLRHVPTTTLLRDDNMNEILAMCHRKPPRNIRNTKQASIIIPSHILPITRNVSTSSLAVSRMKCRKTSGILPKIINE